MEAIMATNIEEVCSFLEQHELSFQMSDDESIVFTAFNTEQYVNNDGEKLLGLMIALEENGEFIKVFAPRCYTLENAEHKEVTFQTLLMISWVTKMVQYEYDHTDGEIRVIIEFPLEDSSLTSRQLMRAIMAIVEVSDRNHSLISDAITKGKIDVNAFSQENQIMGLLQGLMGNMDEMKEGLEEAGIDVSELEEAIDQLQGIVVEGPPQDTDEPTGEGDPDAQQPEPVSDDANSDDELKDDDNKDEDEWL